MKLFLSDALIYGLGTLFFASIIFWAFSAYAEMLAYKTIANASKVLRDIVTCVKETATDGPTDYLIIEGLYKNRKTICRLNRIASNAWWNLRLSLHCHVEPSGSQPDKTERPEPLSAREHRMYYPSTSATLICTPTMKEKLSRRELTAILEELTRAAEVIENSDPR